ncbi:MAG: PQQ-dependent sugar dehydrogenase [Thermoleophilia bacterium]
MRLRIVLLAAAVAVAALVPASAGAALRLVRVAAGLDQPVHVSAPSSEPGALYVVQQGGTIVVLGKGARRTFLDVSDRVSCCGEQGLLSVAFHPRYAENGRFFVNYTNRSSDTEVVEYRASGGVADPGSARLLLRVAQPYQNHNGGQLAFGRDGKLYIGMGDGGDAGDPAERAQSPRSLLGKLLRMDVDVDRPAARIVAYGLRNPWRFSFDRANGDLYVGDVGQDRVEEIDYVRGGVARLLNFGWDAFEGNDRYEGTRLGPGKRVGPIATYQHGSGRCSVTGGYVYRGAKSKALRGRYVYGDFCSGEIWTLRVRDGKARGKRLEAPRVQGLSSFGEDARGEVYAMSLYGGTLYRLSA